MQAAHNKTVNNHLAQENIKVKHTRLARAKTAEERWRTKWGIVERFVR